MNPIRQFVETKKSVNKIILDIQAMLSTQCLTVTLAKELQDLNNDLENYILELAQSINSNTTFASKDLQKLMCRFCSTILKSIEYVEKHHPEGYKKFVGLVTV